ncbi:MAG: prolyl oligopeptidase family serine peptidase, partial [Luteitalea sp.]|nr:prolyl oligopeptidase family serine peptidase [Luteitalea sp.]
MDWQAGRPALRVSSRETEVAVGVVRSLRSVILLSVAIMAPALAGAQGTLADYERATSLRERYEAAAENIAGPARWIDDTNRFWYRKSVKGGHQFVMVDAATLEKQPAFDHEKIAAALARATGEPQKAFDLPSRGIDFAAKGERLELRIDGERWECNLSDYTCQRSERTGLFDREQAPPPCSQSARSDEPTASPDGKWEAFIDNYNVAIRATGSTDVVHLSLDGSEGNCYVLTSLEWSLDSTKLAAYRLKPGHRRLVHYIESSPDDQLQPKHSTRFYPKPGDVIDVEQPVLFHVDSRESASASLRRDKQIIVDNKLFPNAFGLSELEWREDSSAVTFEYNERGHQLYRVIEVDAKTGKVHAVVSEESKTFFSYSGKKFRHDVDDGKEIVWMSERDGWNHLYLYDGATGTVKNQITKGPWVVRDVSKVDEERRQIWFSASGMYEGQDPYFLHYYRINFDGSGLLELTEAEANHQVSLSPDGTLYVDTYSRVDLAPVMELRRASDGSLVKEIERGDLTALKQAGWRPPEVFTALGRDGRTDIWGVIYRPTNFNPANEYPVIENMYAGPQDSFVPKSFSPYSPMQAQAELGFIVVQIDGMGTSNRSKAFHDVTWKNLKDAGFADRILWHKALAAKDPSYDISRVGIYGNSAGGQSALGALLFHPDFYKVAVSSAGSHDNRMDKIWWNEQWRRRSETRPVRRSESDPP